MNVLFAKSFVNSRNFFLRMDFRIFRFQVFSKNRGNEILDVSAFQRNYEKAIFVILRCKRALPGLKTF
jgi:hypothetical protein